jgi:hypothetical protein
VRWRKKSDWRWQRSCGNYAVTRQLTFDTDRQNPTWVYLAWLTPDNEPLSGTGRASLEEAIADATAHLLAQQPNAAAVTTQGAAT